MIIDLFHNKLVKDTATDAFVQSFNSLLVPMIADKYGDSVEAITMYEDYLGDNFLYEGAWHYPLSVKLAGEDAIILWVKWPVTKKTFRNNIPYAYIGGETVDFSFADFVPDEFAAKLQGRAIDYDRKAIKISVDAVTDDPLILVGKYSQTFVDELARQITADVSSTLGVRGFENTTMELQLVFAPGTYLEHTSENVTYRRLLLVEKNCQARDFWVKWTRLDGNGGFRMSEHANAENVEFRIGEDASQKIREKEYRFLAGANPNKYQSAMGKKTVTEWRDIIKRAIKREELVKVVTEKELANHADDVFNVFSALQNAAAKNVESDQHVPVVESAAVVKKDPYDVVAALSEQLNNPVTEAETESNAADDDIAALVRATLGNVAAAQNNTQADETEAADSSDDVDLALDTADDVTAEEEIDDVVEPVFTPISAASDVFALVNDTEDDASDLADDGETDTEEEFAMGEVTFEEYERTVVKAQPKATVTVDSDMLIREREAQIRLEQETEARLKAEQERENLRIERERLLAENARLIRLAKEEEDRRIREEEARRLEEEERKKQLALQKAEEERMRLELEARKRREEQERFRLAETARMAVEEQKRIEAERQAKIEREKQEALAREAERLRVQEENRRLEEERLREERRQREEEARRLEEQERQRRAEEASRTRAQIVEKNVNLVFRNSFDPNIMPRIKEIIDETISALDKSSVDLHIRAFKGDYNLIILQFKLPADEMDLLVNICKAIGNARIGVIKVSIE